MVDLVNMEQLREDIAIYRAKHGLTLREMAEKCGVDYTTMQKAESGSRITRRSTIAKILIVIKGE